MNGLFAGIGILYLGIIVLMIASMWKIFVKAGQPGWAAIVPIYNIYVLLLIIKKPWWWILMFLIPIVNLVFAIWMINLLSKAFGQGAGFTIGLILLGFIFYPMLAFGNYTYQYAENTNNSGAIDANI